MDTIRSTTPSATSGSASAPFLPPQQIVQDLRKFVQSSAEPPTTTTPILAPGPETIGLSDAGFILLRLKEQLLMLDSRAYGPSFVAEFTSRHLNGVDLLVRVITVLQGIINGSNSSNPSRLPSLLPPRQNNSRRRKAAVAEADCIECIKLLLQRSQAAWRPVRENPGNLEILLLSIHSPQLDSKCYALEVLVVRLMNKLIAQAPNLNCRLLAQTEVELSGFSAENVEKIVSENGRALHGTDTLNNELTIWRESYVPISMLAAAGVVNWGPDAGFEIDPNPIYGRGEYFSGEQDTTARSETGRRTMRNGRMGVGRNVERQRLRRQPGLMDSPRIVQQQQYPTTAGRSQADGSFYPSDRAMTLTKSWEALHQPHIHDREAARAGYPLTRAERHPRFGERETRFLPSSYADQESSVGNNNNMRRAKSEVTIFHPSSQPDEALSVRTNVSGRSGGLKRMQTAPEGAEYPSTRGGGGQGLSRSTYDLRSNDYLLRPVSPTIRRVHQSQHERPLYSRPLTPRRSPDPRAMNPHLIEASVIGGSPEPQPSTFYPSPPSSGGAQQQQQQQQQQNQQQIKPKAVKMQGFSYLFPSQPVLDSVPIKRAASPGPFREPRTQPAARPPSAPAFDRRPASPMASTMMTSPTSTQGGYTEQYKQNGEVVYIPIAVEGTNTILRRPHSRQTSTPSGRLFASRGQYNSPNRRDLGEQFSLPTDSRSASPQVAKQRHYGDEVKDALSQFDYLNEYEGGGSRAASRYGTTNQTYHF